MGKRIKGKKGEKRQKWIKKAACLQAALARCFSLHLEKGFITDTFLALRKCWEHPGIGIGPKQSPSPSPGPHVPPRAEWSRTRSHLNSRLVTGYLSMANGFTVTSRPGCSSSLCSSEPDPIQNLPPGSCTMLSCTPSAGSEDIRHEEFHF